jgi:ABC-type sugar transport system ATPase subunit
MIGSVERRQARPGTDGVAAPVLEVQSVSKSYGAVRAVTDVSFSLSGGEVLALLGDNGAGKSTLVKIISGWTPADSGDVLLDGRVVRFDSPQEAQAAGIETVYQELMLVGTLDVAANLFLNREIITQLPVLRWIGWLDKPRMYEQTQKTLDRLSIRVASVRQLVETLSGGQRQSVAVGRAVAWGRHVVLMDEPVAALGVEQSRQVLDLVGELRSNGVAVIFITHNMHQVMDLCDRAVVLWHGQKVGDVEISDVQVRDLVDMITGATVEHPKTSDPR